jgi:hypothetical protein
MPSERLTGAGEVLYLGAAPLIEFLVRREAPVGVSIVYGLLE